MSERQIHSLSLSTSTGKVRNVAAPGEKGQRCRLTPSVAFCRLLCSSFPSERTHSLSTSFRKSIFLNYSTPQCLYTVLKLRGLCEVIVGCSGNLNEKSRDPRGQLRLAILHTVFQGTYARPNDFVKSSVALTSPVPAHFFPIPVWSCNCPYL